MSASRFPELRPHQLPDPPAWLAGRDTELDALDQMLAVPGHGQVTVVISGVPGVGKTALAAWWLHQHRRHFRDGQLHARLAGPHGLGETPSEALARWLRALDVAAISIPASEADRMRLWQSMTAGRRLALMVDDAPSKEAVTALLPGRGPAVVVVTSHRVLGASPAAGFRQLRLRPLKRAAAITLLDRQLGQAPAAGRTAVITELSRACSGLPLALRCAKWLAARSADPLTDLAAQLASEESWLLARGVPRSEARASAVIGVTSQQLEAAAARAFRLLSLCPGPEVSNELAAAVLDTSPAHARKLLEELAMAGLAQPAGRGWWQFHDLAHQRAREQARRTGTEQERRVATSQMLTWYACAAISAHAVLAGSAGPPSATRTSQQDGSPISPDQSSVWVDRHQPAMVAALRAAAARGDHAAAVRLAGVLWPLLGWHGRYAEELAVARLGVRAARAYGDAPAEARMGVALLQGPAELGRCGLAGHGGGSSPTVSGRSEEMPDGFADRRTAAA